MNKTSRHAFTLVELMAVTVLLSLAVGMVTISLNGVTRKGRLTAAMRQVASFDQAARVQALAEGRPRRLELKRDSGHLRVSKQVSANGRWGWSNASTLRLVHGPHVQKVVIVEQSNLTHSSSELWRIRIRSDGTSVSYAVQLGLTDDSDATPAIAVDGISGESRVVWDHHQIEQTLDELRLGACIEPVSP